MDFIETQIVAFPDLADLYTTLGTLYEKKLWHQLSLALEAFVVDKNIRGDNMVQLYDRFIATFEVRLNQVNLAGLVSSISRFMNDAAKSLLFVTKVLEARSRLGSEAAMCLDMDVITLKLKLGDVDAAKDLLAEATAKLPEIKSTESVVFAKYYRATAEYKKVVGPASDFYNAALMFLSYASVDDLHAEDRISLATDMALSSITGENIYNFGEVLATPILQSLVGTPQEWLMLLVEAMNSGNVEQFNSVLEAHKQQYFAQPVLASSDERVKQKIVLLSALNIAFERPSHDRQIAFKDFSQRAGIPLDQVEWVLMKAMSLGLLRGMIDQVDQVVNVTWVQPRVLDKQQIGLLDAQLNTWTEKVKSALVTVEDQAAELYV